MVTWIQLQTVVVHCKPKSTPTFPIVFNTLLNTVFSCLHVFAFNKNITNFMSYILMPEGLLGCFSDGASVVGELLWGGPIIFKGGPQLVFFFLLLRLYISLLQGCLCTHWLWLPAPDRSSEGSASLSSAPRLTPQVGCSGSSPRAVEWEKETYTLTTVHH